MRTAIKLTPIIAILVITSPSGGPHVRRAGTDVRTPHSLDSSAIPNPDRESIPRRGSSVRPEQSRRACPCEGRGSTERNGVEWPPGAGPLMLRPLEASSGGAAHAISTPAPFLPPHDRTFDFFSTAIL